MASDDFQYAFVWVGSENGRPQGTKASGFAAAPYLDTAKIGRDLTDIVVGSGEGIGQTTDVLEVADTLEPEVWAGSFFRLGSPALPIPGFGICITNTANTITIQWGAVGAAEGTHANGYFYREDNPAFPEVRCLVPFQPEGADAAGTEVAKFYPTTPVIAPPGFTVPARVSVWQQWGLFLDFSFLEGVFGYGISDTAQGPTGGGPIVAVDAVSLTWTTPIVGDTSLDGVFEQGFVWVQSGATGENQSWARVNLNTSTLIALSGVWGVFGTPVGGTMADWKYQVWVPHWKSSPHGYIPGDGFRYANNDTQPAASDGATNQIQNFPRGILEQVGDQFGMMLEFAFRSSLAIGQRINMIHLSINDTTLMPRNLPNQDGLQGILGWWDFQTKMSDWSTAKTQGPADRIEEMIKTIAPGAAEAEGGKPIRILGIILPFGEADAVISAGRETYQGALRNFLAFLRKTITDATDINGDSLNPYAAAAKIPVVHPLIASSPSEDAGNDELGLVNKSIQDIMISDGFGAIVEVDDAEKQGDGEHYTGGGEDLIGGRISRAMNPLVSAAVAHGSQVDDDPSLVPLQICNLALNHIGELQIKSLDTTIDKSARAKRCADFYPIARDQALQRQQWGFAMRRVAMQATLEDPPSTWLFSYVVPGDLLQAVAILPKEAIDDYSAQSASSTGGFRFDSAGSQPTLVFGQEERPRIHGIYTPAKFEIEEGGAGTKRLYTNVEEAQLRYVGQVVDGDAFPDTFIMALSYTLAALLAGTTIKGQEGAAVSERMLVKARAIEAGAVDNDAEQRTTRVEHVVPWHANR